MTQYLLDTTPLTALVLNRPAAVARITPLMQRHEANTSILAYGEVVEYLLGRAAFPRRLTELRTLLREVYPYFLTYPILERYAELRRQLRPPYGPGLIGDIDTLIAATALEHDLVVVTTDGDFERVPGLRFILLERRTFAILQQRGVSQ